MNIIIYYLHFRAYICNVRWKLTVIKVGAYAKKCDGGLFAKSTNRKDIN